MFKWMRSRPLMYVWVDFINNLSDGIDWEFLLTSFRSLFRLRERSYTYRHQGREWNGFVSASVSEREDDVKHQ